MILFLVLLTLDQYAKFIIASNDIDINVINHILNISYVENSGIVFGFFQGTNGLMIFISSIICGVLLVFALKYFKNNKFKLNIVYLILAGGIGNLIDRIFRGFVVDYIDTPFIATFNLADSYVVIGVILLLICEIWPKGRNENNR
jgi:signal peptidase II